MRVLSFVIVFIPLTSYADSPGHSTQVAQSRTGARGVTPTQTRNSAFEASELNFDGIDEANARVQADRIARETKIRELWVEKAKAISAEYESRSKPLDRDFISAVEKAVQEKYKGANLTGLGTLTTQALGGALDIYSGKLDPFAGQLVKLFGEKGTKPSKVDLSTFSEEELQALQKEKDPDSISREKEKKPSSGGEGTEKEKREAKKSPEDEGRDLLEGLAKEAEKQNPKSEEPAKEDTKLTSGEEAPKDTNPAGVKPSESVLGDNSVLPASTDVPAEGDSLSSGRGVNPGQTPKENGILAKSGYQDFLQDVENLETNAAIAQEETEEFVEVDDDGTHGEESFVSADSDDDDSGERIADSDDEEDDSVAALKAQADLIREAQAALADPNASTADLSDKLRNLLDFTDGKSIIPDDVLRTIANRPRDTVKIIERTTSRDPFAAFIPQGEKKPLIARDGNPFRSALDGAALVGGNGQSLAPGERLPSTVSVKKKGEPDFRKFGKPKKKKKDKKLVKKKKKGALAKKSKKPKSLWAKAKEISKSLIQGLWAAIAAKKNLKPLTKEEAVALAKMPRPTTEYTQAALLARLSPQMAGLVVQDGALSVGQVVPAAAGAMLALMLVWMVRAFFRRIVIAVDKRRKA